MHRDLRSLELTSASTTALRMPNSEVGYMTQDGLSEGPLSAGIAPDGRRRNKEYTEASCSPRYHLARENGLNGID
jgi:hypothetical protein